MNLNYKILWYDDDKDFFESQDKEPIESEIASWGFRVQITAVHNAEELQQHEPFTQFDMLVVDFDLGSGVHGDQFIKSVREQNVFSEIIFYSMKESSYLWRAISENQLEGVFVANKRSIEPKLIRVARQSVRKVLDLENMRGIVMSEVGDLDVLLESIFKSAMQQLEPDKQSIIFDRFHEKTSEQQQTFDAALTVFKESPSIDGLIALCDSDKRWQNLNRVKKHHGVLKEKNFVGDYQREILWPRNCLAHGVPQKNEDGDGYTFRHRAKEYLFDEEISRVLRSRILEYKSAFAEISDLLVK